MRMAPGCCGALGCSAALNSPLIGTAGCFKLAALGAAYILVTLATLGTSFIVFSSCLGTSYLLKFEAFSHGLSSYFLITSAIMLSETI